MDSETTYNEANKSSLGATLVGDSGRLPLNEQEKSLSELHDTIGGLEKRLVAVLTPLDSADTAGLDEPEPMTSPLGTQLTANNRSIRSATQKLRSIMDKLEC